MTHSIIVLDANVAVKLLHLEPDTEQAQKLLRHCVAENVKILVPEHFLYETVAVCQRLGVGVDDVLALYKGLKDTILTVVSPSVKTWQRAEIIAKDGHKNSGFPSIYDSIYHALAIDADGTFITADKRHAAKTMHHGGICMLKDWTA